MKLTRNFTDFYRHVPPANDKELRCLETFLTDADTKKKGREF